MKSRNRFVVAALVCALSMGLSVAAGKEEPGGAPDQMEMMQKWQAYMTPGDPHAEFEEMNGTWDYTTKMWYAPGMPPQESKGSAEFETIMGGRYMVQHATSPFMGETYHGMGLTAYDNIKKKYQAIWVDNMGTGIMYSEGTCKDKVCTYIGQAPDVMLGKYKELKSVVRMVTNDEMLFEMYEKGPDGKEWKNFEMTYTRRK